MKIVLQRKDSAFYTQNGLLNMLDRNRRIKEKPERFQENQDEFDLIVTCQERVFDQVLESKSLSTLYFELRNVIMFDLIWRWY